MLLNINATLEMLGEQLALVYSLKRHNGPIDEETYLFEKRVRKSYSLVLDLHDEIVKKIKKEYKDGPKE